MPYSESLQKHKPVILLKKKAGMRFVYRLLLHLCGSKIRSQRALLCTGVQE